jgi:hypothetical protein
MGQMAKWNRIERFIEEFQQDILRVYGLPIAAWLRRQWLDADVDGRVGLHVELRTDDGSCIEAVVQGPTYFYVDACDDENLEVLVEAMDVREGIDREEILARMRKAGLIANEEGERA